jgi:hypothetical protein
VEQSAGVDVAGARAHDQAFERGQAHARLDRAAVLDGAHAAAVAEVTRDQPQVPEVGLEVVRDPTRDVLVADSVEAKAPDPVLVAQILRKRVPLCTTRKRLVKGRVEHRDVRRVGQQLLRRSNAAQVRGVVQRRERERLLDRGFDLCGDELGPVEFLAAVHHAMSDRLERRRFGQPLEHARDREVQGSLVITRRCARLPVAAIESNPRFPFADPLHARRSAPLAGFVVEDLALERAAAAVDDEDVHGSVPGGF